MNELAAKLSAIVHHESAAAGLPTPRLVVEPGRAIAGPGTITLYEVGTVKDVDVSASANRRYVSVDGGMSDNIRTALYAAQYDVRLVHESATPRRRRPDWSESIVRAVMSSCVTHGSLTTSSRATWSRWPRPEPTATRFPAVTT